MDEARKESEEWHKQEQARENPLHMKADEDVWEQLGKSDLLRAVGEALGRIRGEEVRRGGDRGGGEQAKVGNRGWIREMRQHQGGGD